MFIENNNLQQKMAELNLLVEHVKLENIKAEANDENFTVTELCESFGEIKVEHNTIVSAKHTHISSQNHILK